MKFQKHNNSIDLILFFHFSFKVKKIALKTWFLSSYFTRAKVLQRQFGKLHVTCDSLQSDEKSCSNARFYLLDNFEEDGEDNAITVSLSPPHWICIAFKITTYSHNELLLRFYVIDYCHEPPIPCFRNNNPKHLERQLRWSLQ